MTLSAISGLLSTRLRKLDAVITSASTSDVVVTVAFRGWSISSAISPKNSPGPAVSIRLPLRLISAVPSARTKNSRPGAPSLISVFPDLKSISSAIIEIRSSSFFEQPANSGTVRIRSILRFLRSTVARV